MMEIFLILSNGVIVVGVYALLRSVLVHPKMLRVILWAYEQPDWHYWAARVRRMDYLRFLMCFWLPWSYWLNQYGIPIEASRKADGSKNPRAAD